MFIILNRLRGTNSLYSKAIGLLLAILVYVFFNNIYVALSVGFGYIIGESFGWGDWVGNLVNHRLNTTQHLGFEGKHNGIQWLAKKIVPNYLTNYIKYCRIALIIRGFYWWFLALIPLIFIGFNPLIILFCIVFLSVGFPIACELGYKYKDRVKFNLLGVSFTNGWSIQEGFYGLFQDIVILILIWSII